MIQLDKFKCGICGKEWNTPRERAQCEIKCDGIEQKKAEHARIESFINLTREEALAIRWHMGACDNVVSKQTPKLKAEIVQHTTELQFKWDEFWKSVDAYHVRFNKPVVLKIGRDNMLRVDFIRSLLALCN